MSEVEHVGESPIIGRSRELETVATALDSPARRGVFLIGEAGVGKTRLADECRRLARDRAMVVVSASANASSSRLSLGVLSHILPPPADFGDLHQDLQPAHLLQAARRTLAAEADGRRLVLSIDDAHHLDPVSAQLISQLVSIDSAFVIATIRSGERLHEPISELLRSGLVDRLDIGGIEQSDVSAVVAGLLGAPVDGDASSWLAAIAQGNVLFLRELTLSGRDDGTLVFDTAGGRWRLSGVRRPTSPRLAELLEYRLDGLTGDERRAVDFIGSAEPLPLELAEELLGLDALDALDRRGLVRVVADGRRLRLSLSHPLYGETIRRSSMSIRKRADLGALAESVLRRGARRRDDAVRMATWQLARGGRVDPEVLLRAALAAQLGFDDYLAVDLADAGLQQDPRGEIRTEFLLCRGLALSRMGRFAAAVVDLQKAWLDSVTPEQVGRSAIRLAAATLEHNGDLTSALATLDEGLGRLQGHDAEVDVRLERATLLADAGFAAEAIEEIARIPASGLHAGQRVVLALANGSERLHAGLPLAALRVVDSGLHDHLSNLDEATTYHPASHFLPRILALIDSAQLDRAEHDARWLFDRATEERRPIALTASRLFIAMIQLRRGRARSCLATVTETQSSYPTDIQPYLRRVAWALKAQAHSALGDAVAARSSLNSFHDAPAAVDGFGLVEYLLAASRVETINGNRPAASKVLNDELERAARTGNRRVELCALDELVHEHRNRDAAVRLVSLTESLTDDLSRARRARALASLSGEEVDIVAAVDRYNDVGMFLRSAEIAAQAARDAKASGNARGGSRFERLAGEALAKCEHASTPMLAGLEAHVPLTEREREIALLVGAGATSKEVGERLHLSARTIDNHLQRIFAKLGVSSRRDLRDAVGGG